MAGRRWGKTYFSAVLLFLTAISKPNLNCAYVAPTYKMAKRIMWKTLKKIVDPAKLAKKPNESDLTILLDNGSTISLFGADNYDSLRGIGLDLIVCDEFDYFKDNNIWELVLRPTLTDREGDALFVGTPRGWSKLDELSKNKGKDWTFLHYESKDNPLLNPAEIEAAKNSMDPKLFAQEYLAKPTNTTDDAVYYMFNRELHVKDAIKYNKNAPVYCGVDFGVNPSTCIVAQEASNGELHIIDEIIQYNSNTRQLAEEILKQYGKCELWCDATGATSSMQLGLGFSDHNILKNYGFSVKSRRIKTQYDKINALGVFLLSAANKTKLFISPKCKLLIDSLERYTLNSKDHQWSHAVDACSYLVLGKYNPCGYHNIAQY